MALTVAPELSVRQVTSEDSELLLCLARACPPLDVHTPYTYWVISHLFADTSFVLVDGAHGRIAGYVTGVPGGDGETILCWQVGVLPEYRGWGGSNLLFGAVAQRAIELGLIRLETTISPVNEASRAALASFVRRSGWEAEVVRDIDVPERGEDPNETLFVIHLDRERTS